MRPESTPEETILKELFQQLKQEDERRAPSFAGSWRAAQARLTPRRQNHRAWRFGMAAAAVLIVAGMIGWFASGKRPANPSDPNRQLLTGSLVSATPLPKPPAAFPPVVALNQESAQGHPRNHPRTQRRTRRQTVPNGAEEVEVVTQFFPLREGEDLTALENLRRVRVELPGSALGEVGLPVAIDAANTPVKADIILGDDGLARAIRFVH